MRKFYPKKKRAYKKKTYAKRKPTVTKSVRTYVKKALDRRIENKEVVKAQNNLGFFQIGVNSIISSFCADLNPIIVQSVSESGRIGNAVKLKSAYMRGVLQYNATSVGGVTPINLGQYHVRLFIGRLKNSINVPSTPDLNQLLRAGSATFPFDSGNGLSLCRTVNSELFTIYYDKIHKIGSQHNVNGTANTGIGNNDFSLTKILKINCTKMFKKNLVYLDTTINTPTNNGLYMWGAVCDSMMSSTVQAAPLVLLNYDLEFSYEDA